MMTERGSSGRRLAPRLGTLVSAVAVAASLPPWDVPGVAWIALVPWLEAMRRAPNGLASAIQGFWLAFFVGLLVAPWLAVALSEFLLIPWPVAILGLVLFAAVGAQPHFVVLAPVIHWLVSRSNAAEGATGSIATVLALALAWMGLDVLVPRLFDVGLGYALHDADRLRQLADLGGVALLTFLLALVNLVVWRVGTSLGSRRRDAAVALLVLGGVLVLAGLGYGEARNRAIAASVPAPRALSVAIVQGNVANPVRLAWAAGDDRAAEKQLSAYTTLTEELITEDPRPDLVVWPEATFPGVFRQGNSKAQRGRSAKFDRQVLRLGVPIAFGAYDAEETRESRTIFNSLFLINPNYAKPGSLGFVQSYRKHVLLPFAETMPFSSPDSWLHGLLPTVGFFGSGPGAERMRLTPPSQPPIQITPIICSEALDAHHVGEGVRGGGQLILNVGSDGWFGSYGEPEFHLAISRLRSVETRRPQIRAANTGISALILPNGEITARSSLGVRETLHVEVPVHTAAQEPSVFLKGGSHFGRVGGAIGIAGVLLLGFSRRQHPSSPSDNEG